MRLKWDNGAVQLEPEAGDAGRREGTVLIVDDNPVVLKVLGLQLSDWGYQVHKAEGADAALTSFASREIETVVANLNLKGLGGLGLIESLRRQAPYLPVIVLVHQLNSLEVRAAMRAGAFDTIVFEEVGVIRQVLDGEPPDPDKVDPLRGALQRAVNNTRLARYSEQLTAQLSNSNELLAKEREQLRATLDQLRATERDLMQAEKTAGLVTATHGVANAIRNPLTVLESNLGLVRDWALAMARIPGSDRIPATVEMSEILEEMANGMERIRGTVNAMTRLAPNPRVRTDAVAVQPLLARTVENLEPEWRKRARLDLDCRVQQPVRGSAVLLEEILSELLTNAIEACDGKAGGGIVRLVAWQRDGQILIQVSDNGEGIAPDRLGKIFDPFYTTRLKRNARGLGLTIAKDAAARLAGSLEVESEPGRGSTVTLTLAPWAEPRRDTLPNGLEGLVEES